MAERFRFPSVFAVFVFFFFHAAILKQHERQRESTLAAQFDLTSSEIKDCACKEGSQGTFVGDQNFSHYVTEE